MYKRQVFSSKTLQAVLVTLCVLLSLVTVAPTALAVDAPDLTTWDGLQKAVQTSGTYTLTQDITAPDSKVGPISVPKGATVTIDLNGFTMNRNLTAAQENGHVIENNGTLTITDSSQAASGKVTGGNSSNSAGGVLNYGVFTLSGGSITGNTGKSAGGVVNMDTFTMKGGSITENKGDHAGGVWNAFFCTFNLEQGSITKNTANGAGGVSNAGSFTLTDGTIAENSGEQAGGVWNTNAFTMDGGSIAKNSGKLVGGVSVDAATPVQSHAAPADPQITETAADAQPKEEEKSRGLMNLFRSARTSETAEDKAESAATPPKQVTFNLNGGSITENHAKEQVGGISLNGKDAVMNLSGAVVVKDNTATDAKAASNLFLPDGAVVNLTAALADDAAIGISMKTPGVFTAGKAVVNTDYASKFFSDNADYTLFTKDNQLKLAKSVTVTFNLSGKGEASTQTLEQGTAVAKPADPTAEGFTFSGWHTDEACTAAYDFAAAVTQDITLYAKWDMNVPTVSIGSDYSATYDGKGHELTAAVSGGFAPETLSYAWAKDGTPIEGATKSTYTVQNVADSGKYTCTVTVNGGSDNGSITSDPVTVTISPKEIAIDWAEDAFQYNGAAQAVTASYKDAAGQSVNLAVAMDQEFKAVGSYTATAAFANGETNYTLPSTTTKSYTMAKKTIEVKLEAGGGTYGSTITPATATVSGEISGEPAKITLTYTGADYNSTTVPTNVGNYTVTASLEESNYTMASEVKADFVITKKTVKVPTIDGVTFNGQVQKPNLSSNDDYTVTANEGGTNAGTYPVELTLKDSVNSVWEGSADSTVRLDFTISPMEVSISWPEDEFVYNGAVQTIGATYKDAGGKSVNLTVTTDKEFKGVGNYTAIAGFAGGETNYKLPSSTTKAYTMNKKPIEVKISAGGGTYGDKITPASATISGEVSGEAAKISLTYTGSGYNSNEVPKNAGKYTVTVNLAESNYTLTGNTKADFTINKQVVKPPKISNKQYNGQNQTANVSGTALYDVTENKGGTNSGTYLVKLTLKDPANYTWEGNGNATIHLNFNISGEGNYWVSKPGINGWVYGSTPNQHFGEAKFGHIQVEYRPAKGSDKDYSPAVPTAAGEYRVRFTASDGNKHPTITAEQNLTISPKTIGIQWGDTTLTYNGKEQAPTATATGLAGNDVCTLTVSGKETALGKDYTATVTELSNPNYVLPKTGLTTNFTITDGKDEKPDPNKPSGNQMGKILTKKSDLMKSVPFTPEEQSLIDTGSEAKITLDVQDISKSIDYADKTKLNKHLDKQTVGTYYNASFYKQVGTLGEQKVLTMNQPVSVSVKVPEELQDAGFLHKRSFAVLSKTGELDSSYDKKSGELSFKMDKSDDYAVVYKDKLSVWAIIIPIVIVVVAVGLFLLKKYRDMYYE